jgi:hypothetical protein
VEDARHLFRLAESQRFLPESVLKIIHPVIKRNGFYAHPENVLLSLIVIDNTCCCVYNCNSKAKRSKNLSFHIFPKKKGANLTAIENKFG